jgi:hypothetical protein
VRPRGIDDVDNKFPRDPKYAARSSHVLVSGDGPIALAVTSPMEDSVPHDAAKGLATASPSSGDSVFQRSPHP